MTRDSPMNPTLPSPMKHFPIPSPTPPLLSPCCQDLPSCMTPDIEHYRISFDSGLADDFRNDLPDNLESHEVNGVRGEFPGLLVTLSQSPRKSTA